MCRNALVVQVADHLPKPGLVAEHDGRRVAIADWRMTGTVGVDRPRVLGGVRAQGQQVHRIVVQGRCRSRRARCRASTSTPIRAASFSIRRHHPVDLGDRQPAGQVTVGDRGCGDLHSPGF